MALAMGLPNTIPFREDIILMTFGVVILSLFLQGLTMPKLLRGLKIIGVTRPVYEYEQRLGKVLIHDRALAELKRLKADLFIRPEPYQELADFHQAQLYEAEAALNALGEGEEMILEEQKHDAMKVIRDAQVHSLHDACDRGLLSTEALDYLINYLASDASQEPTDEPDEEQDEDDLNS